MKIQEEKIVSFKTAKLAKEKGFVDVVGVYRGKHYYNHKGKLDGSAADSVVEFLRLKKLGHSPEEADKLNTFSTIAAPPQSLLQKWLREEHNIHIESTLTVGLQYSFKLYDGINHSFTSGVENYEDGLEITLQEALKLI